jgi:hypothetical protein
MEGLWRAWRVQRYGLLALGAGAQTWWMMQHVEAGLALRKATAVMLGTWAAYRLMHALLAVPQAVGGTERRDTLLVAVVLALASALLLWPWWRLLPARLPWVVLPLLAYALPTRDGQGGLRSVPGMKVLVILWCWIIAVLVLPVQLVAPDRLPALLAAWLPVQLPLFAGVALLSDLRDRTTDPLTMRTWPQLLGEGWTRALVILLFFYTGAVVLMRGYFSYDAVVDGRIPGPEFAVAMCCGWAVVLAAMARSTRPAWFFGLLVDGLLLLLPVAYALAML